MQAVIDLANRLDEQAILDMHSTLLGQSQPEIVGRWRDEQVWIGGGHFGPHEALFIPPHASRVPAAMTDLLRFCQRDDVPVLLQAAIAHAQFETIHPFPEGNGRTGRALIHSLLRAKGTTRNVTVPVSAGLLTDVPSYFSALTSYRAGNPNVFIELVANATFIAINNGRELVSELRAAQTRWAALITTRRGSAPHRIAELLVRQPVIDSVVVQRELGIHASNALAAIEHLVDVGILAKVAGNHRNRKWAAQDVLKALDSFASRSGRQAIE